MRSSRIILYTLWFNRQVAVEEDLANGNPIGAASAGFTVAHVRPYKVATGETNRTRERAMPAPSLKAKAAPGRSRAQDIDRYVGARMRERRILLGLTQHQLAELIGVTYQQAHKYEAGINRIAAGRLSSIARALGVEVGYFFESAEADQSSFKPSTQQLLLLELARNFIALSSRKQQEAICHLARTMADPKLASDATEDAATEP
jgi:transcriptional regulator with XRE-family HTH domain